MPIEPTVIIWKGAGWFFTPGKKPEAERGTELLVRGNSHEHAAGQAIGM
jgi:hypothetical protein